MSWDAQHISCATLSVHQALTVAHALILSTSECRTRNGVRNTMRPRLMMFYLVVPVQSVTRYVPQHEAVLDDLGCAAYSSSIADVL